MSNTVEEKILVRLMGDMNETELKRVYSLYHENFPSDNANKNPFAPNTILFLYTINKRLIGYVAIVSTPDLMNWFSKRNVTDYESYGILTSKGLFIYNLCVFRPQRNRGIASRLMRHIETYARQNGTEYLHLIVKSTNQPAIRIYEKCGYRIKNISYGEEPQTKVLTLVKFLKPGMETMLMWPKTALI